MKIGTCEAKKGCLTKGWLEVGELAMGSPIRMPVMILQGEKDGPVLWINSTVHGVEVNGILICRELAEEIDPKELEILAKRWEIEHGGYSGRAAQQFIDYLAGKAKA